MNLTENICSGSVGKWKWISNNSAVRLRAAYGNKVVFFPLSSAAYCAVYPFGYTEGVSPACGERTESLCFLPISIISSSVSLSLVTTRGALHSQFKTVSYTQTLNSSSVCNKLF